jgi:hypothetical protein
VAAGQPLALTLQLDPAQGPLTYAWNDQGATTPGATYLRLARAGQVYGHGRAGADLAAGDSLRSGVIR